MSTPNPSPPVSIRDRVYRTDALVIGRLDFGEADRIVTLLTPGEGKVRAIAKGVRRPKARLTAHLEYFRVSRLILARGRDLDVVTSAETIASFPSLSTDLEAYGAASTIVELIGRLVEEGQENRPIYELALLGLGAIDRGVSTQAVVPWVQMRVFRHAGFRPELYRCIRCEAPMTEQPNGFSIAMGGMICGVCRSEDHRALTLSVNAQKVLRLFDKRALDEMATIRVSTDTYAEVDRLLTLFGRHLTERELASPRVLREIRDGLPVPAYLTPNAD